MITWSIEETVGDRVDQANWELLQVD